jgi:hypothetical protein
MTVLTECSALLHMLLEALRGKLPIAVHASSVRSG